MPPGRLPAGKMVARGQSRDANGEGVERFRTQTRERLVVRLVEAVECGSAHVLSIQEIPSRRAQAATTPAGSSGSTNRLGFSPVPVVQGHQARTRLRRPEIR